MRLDQELMISEEVKVKRNNFLIKNVTKTVPVFVFWL